MPKLIKIISINLFIVINLLMMIRAQIDDKKPLAKLIYKPITPIQNYFSVWRGWQMFAPNPLRTNSFVFANVFTKNGVFKYEFTGPQNGTTLERFLIGERFRKYIVEGVRKDKNSHLWEDCALYVKRKYERMYPDKKVLKINLYRKWYDIPKWNQMFIPHKSDSRINFKEYKFYTYYAKESM